MSRFVLSPLASVLLLALGAALTPLSASAQACSPAAPVNGAVVTCTGVGTGIINNALDNATITVETGAVITGAAQGFLFDDDVTLTNNGSITGSGDHGVQGDNDVTVTNNGTITGATDGVNIDNNGVLVNNGTIIGLGDDGVQLEDNAQVTNNRGALIQALDEGVNINTNGARLTNHGTITAGDDGVNAADNAIIINTGTITSNGGAQDGVDLDSGTITNSGTIRAVGVEDGIDFDPGAFASLVTNSGLIEGNIAINTDVADTMVQTVVNSGTLRGTGGTALNLGAGDDSLTIENGSLIDGIIEMGAGTDTVAVNAVRAATLTFGSLPETLTFAGPGILVGAVLVVVDPVPLSLPARLARGVGFGTASAVFSRQSMSEPWVGVWGAGANVGAMGALQGFSERSGGLVGGMGFGGVSGFAGFARAGASLVDGETSLTQTAIVVGLSQARDLGAGGQFSVLGYLGATDTDLRSPAARSGNADYQGMLFGASARFTQQFGAGPQPFDMALQGDLVHHRTQGYALSGLGGGTVSAQSATAWSLRADLGMPVAVTGGVLRPYVFGALRGGDAGALTYTLPGGATTFAAANLLSDSHGGLGLGFATRAGVGQFNAGVELAGNAAGDRALSLRMSFHLPL